MGKKKLSVTAVLLTGGEGRRFEGARVPKQFVKICGKPLFIYPVETYESIPEIDEICLVINEVYRSTYERLLRTYSFKKLNLLVSGGVFRQQSVRNALSRISHEGVVVIQNGVNPMTTPQLIKECIAEALKSGASSAYVPACHTVFEMENGKVRNVPDRKKLGYTCDPQAFRVRVIKQALSESKDESQDIPTIELVRRLGHPVGLVRSDETNIKLTTYLDLLVLRRLLRRKQA